MVCLVCEAKGFHTFCTLFYRFTRIALGARLAATDEKVLLNDLAEAKRRWTEKSIKFASERAKNTARSDHFQKLRCRKVHAVVARSTFRSQKGKKLRVRSTFRHSDVLLRGKRWGLCT